MWSKVATDDNRRRCCGPVEPEVVLTREDVIYDCRTFGCPILLRRLGRPHVDRNMGCLLLGGNQAGQPEAVEDLGTSRVD